MKELVPKRVSIVQLISFHDMIRILVKFANFVNYKSRICDTYVLAPLRKWTRKRRGYSNTINEYMYLFVHAESSIIQLSPEMGDSRGSRHERRARLARPIKP